MAQNSCRNVLQVLGSISCLLLLVHKASAYEFKVGGDGVWKVPSNNASNPYIQWAINNRFQINDTIVFKFEDNKDSVLVVSEEDYKKCDTSHPIESYDGNGGQQTTLTLSHSGPFYFISGLHCDQNEKLVVVVLADRRRHHHGAAPPPQSTNPPATPAPAPAGEGSPPPPPSGPSPSVLINPTPAPSSLDSPPSNSGGFQIVSGFVSSIGVATLVGSLPLLF